MKIAILLGVSKYAESKNDLPACEFDLEFMQKLLNLTGNYEEIYSPSCDGMTASDLKNSLAEWIEKYSKDDKKKIEEIFFYYTGHGEFFKGEFYFQLSDFDAKKRSQTSLTNSELDTWLRGLEPELTVKVIDACNSGVPYIKGDNNDASRVVKYLDSTKGNFENCYFMFSSMAEQPSLQDRQLSYFTKTFLDAVRNSDSTDTRYKHIIDYISDEFENNGDYSQQTPFFVTQAAFTEIFCTITDDIRNLEYVKLAFTPTLDGTNDVPKNSSLKQLVEGDGKYYVGEEDALKILASLKDGFEKYAYPDDINDLYDMERVFQQSVTGLPLRKTIGRWLENSDHEFFAELTYKSVYEDYSSEILSSMGGRRKVQVLDGFEFTADVPFKVVRIRTKRKHPNIHDYHCVVTYLISSSKICLFYFYTRYRYKNWDDKVLVLDTSWTNIERSLNDVELILQSIEKIQGEFAEYILNQLREKFNPES